jgi:HD-GYP domain-containing protein (c-di-GMP phosphodiesterase class II)
MLTHQNTKQEESIYVALYDYTKALSVALGCRDLSTRLHSERVVGLSAEIGVRCGLSSEELEVLKIGAAFHDIGKIGIPDRILLKPAKLEPAEWEIMRQHAELGERIIAATELPGSRRAARVIRHHHERYSGLGYPQGLAGEAIPICCRIIAIADSYDAMAVTRAYHRTRTHAEIMDLLDNETGDKHDPEVMRAFREIIDSSRFKASEAPVTERRLAH